MWDDPTTGMECKCELDAYNHKHNIILDLKTCAGVLPLQFGRAVDNFGYHIQDWWYRWGWQEVHGDSLEDASRTTLFVFIAVKNSPSHHCETYTLSDPRWSEMAQKYVSFWMERIDESIRNDNWETATWGNVVEVPVPGYAGKQLDETISIFSNEDE